MKRADILLRGEQDPYRARGRKDPHNFRPFGEPPLDDEEEGEVFIREATRVLMTEAWSCLFGRKNDDDLPTARGQGPDW
jgi:hypothetical protein